jgi:hypothetical protein
MIKFGNVTLLLAMCSLTGCDDQSTDDSRKMPSAFASNDQALAYVNVGDSTDLATGGRATGGSVGAGGMPATGGSGGSPVVREQSAGGTGGGAP